MYPVTPAFKTLVRQSHQMILRAEIWRGKTKVADIYPLDGEIEIDSRRSNRRTCSLSLAATNGIVPGVNPSDLSPYGNEIHVWRGIRINDSEQVQKTYASLAAVYADYSTLDSAFVTYSDLGATVLVEFERDEWVPQGVFFITDVDVESSVGATVDVKGTDRSLRIARNKWVKRYATEDGDTLDEVLLDLLRNRWQDIETDFPVVTKTVKTRVYGLDTDNDPWKNAQDLAADFGYDLYFDGAGVCVLEPFYDYSDAVPDEVYEEDSEAMVLGVSRSLTNERSYNGVIVTGEGSRQNQVYRGEAWDEDPSSPTYVFGSYGFYPVVLSSSAINSNEVAQRSAERILSNTKGLVESFEWEQIVDPSLDAGDYIELTNTLANVSRSFVIDRLTMPLGPNSNMSCVARTIRIDGRFDEELEP